MTISVIIPVYNHTRELSQCLRSLEEQSFKDFEVIIVNDGSTEKIQISKSKYQNFQIQFFDRPHLGAPAARNFGFSKSRGEYVIFCDADVVMHPDCLKEMYAALQEHPRASYAYSDFRWGWKKFHLWPFDVERLKKDNYIHTTSLMRREAFPGFDESLKRFQDWDVWLTMSEQGNRGVWISKTLFFITERNRGGMSKWFPKFLYRLNTKKVQAFEQAKEIVKKKHNV